MAQSTTPRVIIAFNGSPAELREQVSRGDRLADFVRL